MDYEEKKQLIYKFTFILIIAIFVACIASAYFTYTCMAKIGLENFTKVDKESYAEDSNKNIEQITTNIKNFREVIDRYYIGEIDEEKILDETLKGYVKGLDDEYSEYMTKADWEEFQSNALGNYVGIGIYMGLDKDGNVVIVSPIKETPAEEAGLKSGDIIVEVDGENVIGESTEVVSNKVKGEAGTKVKITVARDNEYKDFEIERKEIKVYHVESEMLENNIGYLSLLTFDEGCADEFKQKYEELKEQGAQKLIIDLRYNTGGIVDESLEILDLIFPKDKTLLITVDAEGNKDITKSENDDTIDMEIVVLANEYTASASEILIGALRDYDKATIVGTTTFGKGVIQNVYMLSDGSVLKLTTNEYFTPNESKIHKVGIEPDEVVELDEESEEDTQLKKAIEILK